MTTASASATPSWLPPFGNQSLVTVLGVVYVHRKTADGGDIYLTRFGLPYATQLEVDNWYEAGWFREHREPLEGTSAVYRLPTRAVNGVSLDLVVKNCRVGEDVPVETRALLAEIAAEFNSPWEEFALVMEMRQSQYGPRELRIRTQEPLGIYVPPETMQMWQTGRSRYKVNRIRARHPGIDLDILKQYWLIYRWIRGRDAVQLLQDLGVDDQHAAIGLKSLTDSVTGDLSRKGYVVADMKAAHVIVEEQDLEEVEQVASSGHPSDVVATTRELVASGRYSVVDYELLRRTPDREEMVKHERRQSYLDDQRDRFIPTELPPHLEQVEIFGVPYIYGHVESTGGKLWVLGRNARLFDYFLPERWRKTPSWRLSQRSEIYYTLTKDSLNLVWKESRVGETPAVSADHPLRDAILERGYNSPFEEFAIAQTMSDRGIRTVYARAIYMTGTEKVEASTDLRRYESHRDLKNSDGTPILREDRNYVSIRGFYNGPDDWVAAHTGGLRWPLNLNEALARGVIQAPEVEQLMESTRARVAAIGYDGSLLDGSDIIVGMHASAGPVRDAEGRPDARVSSFELIGRN